MNFRIIFLAILLSFLVPDANAQTWEPLTPFSKYQCIRFGDGTTGVGRITPNGREIVSPKTVTDELARRYKGLKADQRELKKLKQITKEGSFSKKNLASLRGILNAALFEPFSDALKFLEKKPTSHDTRRQRLAAIEILLNEIRLRLDGVTYERDALTACVGNLPQPDGVPVRLVPFNEYGDRYMILVVADVVPSFKTKKGYGYLYCVKRDTVAYPLYFSKDPCSLVIGEVRYGNCPYAALDQAGKVLTGIVAISSQGSASSQTEIDNLLISAYGAWRGRTVLLKKSASTEICYDLFK